MGSVIISFYASFQDFLLLLKDICEFLHVFLEKTKLIFELWIPK